VRPRQRNERNVERMDKPKVLIVDDDPEFVESTRILLEDAGYCVIAAANGNDGIQKARSDCPDVILLDVMLPDMDGYSVCRELKENADTGEIPVLIMTSIGESRLGGLFAAKIGASHGADGFTEKPVTRSRLTEKIEELLAEKKGDSRESGRAHRILVADDDPDFVAAVEEILKQSGFDVLIAENGVEAIKMARAFRPDVVLLDVMLPGKDGYIVCHELKSDVKTHRMAVILVSAIAQELTKPEYAAQIGTKHGADDFLTKPIVLQELVDHVREAIGK